MNKYTTKYIALRVLRKNVFSAVFLLCVIICVVVFSLLPPQILKLLIDNYLIQKKTTGLLMFAFLYFGSFLLIGLFDFLKGLSLTLNGQKIVREMRSTMAEKLTRIKASYFSKNAGGTISSYFMNDVENVNFLFSEGIISMLIDCFKIVGIVVSIWIFNVWFGLFVVCLLPFIYGLTTLFRKKMLASQTENLIELSKVNNHIAESIKNILMIKCFHKEHYMEDNYEQYLKVNYSTMDKVNMYNSCYSPIIQITTAIVTAVVFLLASGGDGAFGSTIGELAATITLITNLFAPVDNLGTELQSIQKGISGIQSVDLFLAQEEDEKQEVTFDIDTLREKGAYLHFKDVSFAYDEGEQVLSHIALHMMPNENVSFVGRTGVGKTTLFKLITGLLRPSEGTITLNGVDVFHIPANQKRQIFGYVEQQFSFVHGDISMQISLGCEDISQKQIEEAFIFVGLHEYILTLEKGYQTAADGGSMFSQGQKQLLSIARAIVTNPPILLLDEVTANLDSVTEEKVVAVLKKAGKEKTILSISHRMSSVISSHRVILLENGSVKAIGTPDQIIEKSSWLRCNSEIL